MMGFGLIWIVMIILLVVGLIAYGVGWRPDSFQGNQPSRKPGQDALEILQARYARGEISQEEYQQMRRDLEG